MINPHSPTGKVLTNDECLKFDSILSNFPNCIVISDEVYDKFKHDSELEYV